MIYPIKSSDYRISKSVLKNNIQNLNVKGIQYFEHIDKSLMDEVVKEMKRNSNRKDYHLIVLEV
jgi:hypothetical protein